MLENETNNKIGEVKANIGDCDQYLSKTMDYSKERKLIVDMKDFIDKIVTEFNKFDYPIEQ